MTIFISVFSIPEKYYSGGTIKTGTGKTISLNEGTEALNKYFERPVSAVQFTSALRQLRLNFVDPVIVVVKNEMTKGGNRLQFYIPVHQGGLSKDSTAQKNILIQASGSVDKTPVAIRINATKTGREFIGFGGNFRLQNPKTDPQVIDYCLENLRVAFGRVKCPGVSGSPRKQIIPSILQKQAGSILS